MRRHADGLQAFLHTPALQPAGLTTEAAMSIPWSRKDHMRCLKQKARELSKIVDRADVSDERVYDLNIAAQGLVALARWHPDELKLARDTIISLWERGIVRRFYPTPRQTAGGRAKKNDPLRKQFRVIAGGRRV
jgi:hypothetical protein